MRKVKLFIAMSVDGYIADKNGGVVFLQGHEDCLENESTYSEFEGYSGVGVGVEG